jgi:HEPN domain-containing protein
MPKAEGVDRVVAEWASKAEEDLKTAAHMLRLEASSPTAIVCFHAQQAAEKYLKAYLVYRGTHFPKTHDVEELLALIPTGARPELRKQMRGLWPLSGRHS